MTLRHIPPYDFQYRFVVDAAFAGSTLLGFYEKRFGFKPNSYWQSLIDAGDISVNGVVVPSDTQLQQDDVIRTLRRDVLEPPVNAAINVIFERDGVLVLNKPAPVPIHPSGRYFRNSLIHILEEKFPATKFHTIHRLDLWTTGVLILATQPEVARALHRQVEKRTMGKVYAVLATGAFPDQEFVIDAAVGRVAGAQRGTGPNIRDPKESVTRFTQLLKSADVTLLKAEPLTGRTNQIRVHVQAAGGAVLNDPLYGPEPREDIPFMGLHCRSMSFDLLGERVTVTAPWPEGYLQHFGQSELDAVL